MSIENKEYFCLKAYKFDLRFELARRLVNKRKNYLFRGFSYIGRSGGIWTHDPYVPNVVLYQAELHSEEERFLYILF